MTQRDSNPFDFKHRIAYNILSYDIPFTGKTWAQQIDLLSTVWLHSSIGESTAPASQRSWVRIPLSHLNFSGSWDNCLNCPASARIISSFDFKHRIAYNILSYYRVKLDLDGLREARYLRITKTATRRVSVLSLCCDQRQETFVNLGRFQTTTNLWPFLSLCLVMAF